MIPKLNTSLLYEYMLLINAYGDIYIGEPTLYF